MKSLHEQVCTTEKKSYYWTKETFWKAFTNLSVGFCFVVVIVVAVVDVISTETKVNK